MSASLPSQLYEAFTELSLSCVMYDFSQQGYRTAFAAQYGVFPLGAFAFEFRTEGLYFSFRWAGDALEISMYSMREPAILRHRFLLPDSVNPVEQITILVAHALVEGRFMCCVS